MFSPFRSLLYAGCKLSNKFRVEMVRIFEVRCLQFEINLSFLRFNYVYFVWMEPVLGFPESPEGFAGNSLHDPLFVIPDEKDNNKIPFPIFSDNRYPCSLPEIFCLWAGE